MVFDFTEPEWTLTLVSLQLGSVLMHYTVCLTHINNS